MVWGTKLDDVLTGDAGDNRLDGLDGNDRLSGLSGDDLLIGGAGADILDGGAGIDLASYYTSSAGVTVNLISHSASGGEAHGDTLTGIEDLEGSRWNDALTGDDGDNWLYGLSGADTLAGNDGDDVLTGGAGADSLNGGRGLDAASYADSWTGVYVSLLTGKGGYGAAAGDTLVDIEDLIGSDFNDSMHGDSGANWMGGGGGADTLKGEGGNDTLRGGAGADFLYGGAGYNMASYIGSAVGVWVDLGTGIGRYGDAEGDRLSQITDLNGSDFNDRLVGNGGDNWLYGGTGADTLQGGGGDDVLIGGAGADTLNGGAGFDTASYADSWKAVYVNLRSGKGGYGTAAGDTLVDISDLIGSDFNDAMYGDDGDNWLGGGKGADSLRGDGGNDTLRGGAGADYLDGGAGYNMASYADSTAGVRVDLATGKGKGGDAEGDLLSRITDLNGSDFNDRLVGNGGDNWLYGGAGGDTLLGASGDDVLIGGVGGDSLNGGAGRNMVSYIGSAAGVAIDLATGGGSGGDAQGDKLNQISDAVGSDFNDQLGGNAGNNALYGGAGADILWGNGGDDYLKGEAGADTLVGSAGWNWASYVGSSAGVAVDLATGMGSRGDAEGDRLFQITDLVGSDFADQFGGDAGSNALYSEGGADTLWGNGGDDFLGGGGGADRLIGGAGRDLFVYEATTDSGTTAATRDQILDFSRGTDRIDLSDVDANTAATGNQAFSFLGSAAFTGRAGQLRFYAEGNSAIVSGDLNGDRVADFTISVEGAATLAAADFVL